MWFEITVFLIPFNFSKLNKLQLFWRKLNVVVTVFDIQHDYDAEITSKYSFAFHLNSNIVVELYPASHIMMMFALVFILNNDW